MRTRERKCKDVYLFTRGGFFKQVLPGWLDATQNAELEKERYRLRMLEVEETLRRTRRDSATMHKLGDVSPVSVGHVGGKGRLILAREMVSRCVDSRCKSVSQSHRTEADLEMAMEAYPKKVFVL